MFHFAVAMALYSGVLMQDAPPTLIAEGANYAIHASVNKVDEDRSTFVMQRLMRPGIKITYKALDSGKSTVLYESGVTELMTRRTSFNESRLLGVAQDERYLYLATWRMHYYQGENLEKARKESDFGVIVFDKQSGKSEHGDYFLTTAERKKMPSVIPPETLKTGPLRLVKGGATCFGIFVSGKHIPKDPSVSKPPR